MLRKISIGCGGCLLLLALGLGVLWLFGSRLPREHRVASRIEVTRSTEEVWLYVSDFEGQPGWAEGVDEVERTTAPDGREVFIQHSLFGDIPFVVTESESRRRFVTEVLSPDPGWGGSWTWELEPLDPGCRVTLTEEGWDDSPLRRFAAEHLIGQHLSIDMMLQSLSRVLGEEQEPVHLD